MFTCLVAFLGSFSNKNVKKLEKNKIKIVIFSILIYLFLQENTLGVEVFSCVAVVVTR